MRKLIRSTFLKNVIPHFIITLIFVIISLLFYYPLLSGKKLVQSSYFEIATFNQIAIIIVIFVLGFKVQIEQEV